MEPARSGSQSPLVRIEGVAKSFGAFQALHGVSLDIHGGEFFALLGPSGCGKTTLLRTLAGFEQPDGGRIVLAGEDVSQTPPYRRPVNMMFQSYALFPHLTVAGNIAFGLKREGLPRAEVSARVQEMLRLVRLEGLAARRPHQLSGGQKQRVALARALAKRPRLLLLDEPMAALDRQLREETQFELKDIQRRLGMTFIIVTHDQQEAMALADRMGVMENGRLVQVGTPEEIYTRPKNRYVAGFIGEINIIDCFVESLAEEQLTLRRCRGGEKLVLNLPESEREACESLLQPGRAIALTIRPESLVLHPEATAGSASAPGQIAGVIIGAAFLGDQTAYRIASAGGDVLRVTTANTAGAAQAKLPPGTRVVVGVPPDAARLLGE